MKQRRSRAGPTPRDLSRMVLARASTRLAVERGRAAFARTVLEAFRAELGATVRSVSPFLVAMLRHEGLPLDDLMWRLTPAEGWPDEPRIPASGAVFPVDPAASVLPGASLARRVGRPFRTPVPAWHGVSVTSVSGDSIAVHVVDHAVEMAASFQGAWYTTLFGEVRIEIPLGSLERMPAVRPGRPLETALRLPAIRGAGWVAGAAVDAPGSPGVEITAWTGTRRYRMPWLR